MGETYKQGDDVFVFYRMSKRCTPLRKYLAVLDPRQGAYRPRSGISDGWVPARVEKEEGGRVLVSYTWQHFATCRGNFAERDSGWTEWYLAEDVRPAPEGQAGKLCPLGLEPELVLITFRWGGANQVEPPEQWGDTGSSVSDLFIDSFLERAVAPALGNSFEVWTVYVEDHSDMQKLAGVAHLVFGPQHPCRRGKHVGGMYHLYPTSFEEGCVPSQETGQDGGAALVDQKSFFKMQQAVERAGVPTRFPHPSGFYELLSSKRWTYMMSLTPQLRVPPTVCMPRMLCETNLEQAAARALATLNKVRDLQAKMWGLPPPKEGITKGVAKLGFSWEALDVKFWEGKDGPKGLQNALYNLTQNIMISGELTGQPQDLEGILVQEYCEHDLEVRLYVVDGKVESTIYTKFCKIKDNLEFGDFHELFEQGEAAEQWCGGDLAALKDGERQCREIVDHWMVWVQSQLCGLPPAIRFDFFCGRDREQPGKAVVWTLEICELGFSMLGEKTLPNKVFAAMLRQCVGNPAMNFVPSKRTASAGAIPPPSISAVAATNGSARPAAAAVMPATQAPGTATEDTDDDAPPKVLHVLVKDDRRFTQDQVRCSGRYSLMADVTANDAPVWINDRGDRFLFHGIDEYWYVGDEEERDADFNCDQGYIRHHSQERTVPHKVGGLWERGEDWTEDDGIWVSIDGTQPPHTERPAAAGKGGKSGKDARRKK